MTTPDRLREQYLREQVFSASPARLLTMLYDRLMLDLARAEQAQQAEDWTAASGHLHHAQDIVGELIASLDTSAWDGAPGLLAIYGFVMSELVNANIRRDSARTHGALQTLMPLRDAFVEAADLAAADARPATAGRDVA